MSIRSRPGSVFISYKREEAALAAPLRNALMEEGFNVWWDEDLQCGQAWAERLDKAVQDAACIIVLWSERSVASQWVRHEASQAIARNVYAPCRIELVQLESPYDRIQATDLIGWDGNREHGGFRNLIERVDGLVPAPVSLPHRIGRWLHANRAALVASGIAVLAMLLLGTIYFELRRDRREKVYNCSTGKGLRVLLAHGMYSRGESLAGVCLRGAPLREADLSGADLSYADLGRADLYLANLSEANLRVANLSGADLSYADLTGAFVSDANLSEANLRVADLSGANLSSADLSDADLAGADLRGADLIGANLSSADLVGADFLHDADLRHADLSGADLTYADLRGTDLSEANLSGATFDLTDLSEANLRLADLSGADLSEAILSDADLSEADLSDADLSEAILVGANLSGADLIDEANLIGANLIGANLSGADLSRADLSGARNLTQEQLDFALGDDTTVLPEGLTRPAHWSSKQK